MKNIRKFHYVYAVVGKTDYGSRKLYFVNSHTQGAQMLESAWSLATLSKTKADADRIINLMREKYKGIKHYELEYRKVYNEE